MIKVRLRNINPVLNAEQVNEENIERLSLQCKRADIRLGEWILSRPGYESFLICDSRDMQECYERVI